MSAWLFLPRTAARCSLVWKRDCFLGTAAAGLKLPGLPGLVRTLFNFVISHEAVMGAVC